ncbi:MAG: rane protein [Burkholderiaceae bacterium]|nr:rane protein [Burkholderiaceae bacterium]
MLNAFARQLKRFLIALLVYAVATLLLLEDWLWDVTAHVLDRLGAYRLFSLLGARIAALPPYAALATFALPFLSLFPLKVAALFAIAHGHAVWGFALIVGAKLAGTALSAKLYQLTRPALMKLEWLARLLTAFIVFKNRLIAKLESTEAWHKLQWVRASFRRRWRWMRRRWQKRFGKSRLRRLLGKFLARRQAGSQRPEP